jgi:hypothetical protein
LKTNWETLRKVCNRNICASIVSSTLSGFTDVIQLILTNLLLTFLFLGHDSRRNFFVLQFCRVSFCIFRNFQSARANFNSLKNITAPIQGFICNVCFALNNKF